MRAPYIGITGFNASKQVQEVAQHISNYPIGYVMFGFTSSNKRLLNPTKGGKTSPPLDSLFGLVSAVPSNHLPMVHYFTSNPDSLADEVIALFDYCHLNTHNAHGPFTHCGLQLNASWPDPEQLQKIQKWAVEQKHGAVKDIFHTTFITDDPIAITLQLPKEVLAHPKDIIPRLREYQNLISYVLIDPSGGNAIDVDIEQAAQLMFEINKQVPMITPGLAGGFTADNVAERIKIIKTADTCEHCGHTKEYGYCIDAQGGLRTNSFITPVYPKDAEPIKVSTLSTGLATKYIDNAISAFFED